MEAPDGLTFRSHYWDDRQAREAFKVFLIRIHGLDLSLWERKGFWDDVDYLPFSLFDGAQVVSSVCLYSLPMIVGGRALRLGQLSGVGTLPAYRRRGLNRWLTERALASTRPTHQGFFLFADEAAVSFYRRCGFQLHAEQAVRVTLTPPPFRPGLRRLAADSDRDLALLYELAAARAPVSVRLGMLAPKLLMFHALYTLRDRLYHLPDLDVAVAFEVSNRRLTLFDVIGRRIPEFPELHPYLAQTPHDEVVFEFMPDRMGIVASGTEPRPEHHAHLHPGGIAPEPGDLFPFTAHA